MKKRFLSVFMVLCMMLTMVPSAFAEGADGDTLQSKIDQASENATIALDKAYTESITIPAGKTITLDLNGWTLTNAEGKHTITNKGTLTIMGTGTVDNVSHGKGAVYNDAGATCTILGGNYTRSQENGQSDSDSGGNSWYAIKNFGTMTIGQEGASNDAVKVSFTGKYSSLVANGWQDGKTAGNTNKEPAHVQDAQLTIHSGTFTGGINTIKNDDYGNLTITGGVFENVAHYAVMNWNTASISGGTFHSDEWAVVNCGNSNLSMDKGELTISGGSFSGTNGSVSRTTDAAAPQITGGTFSSDVSAFAGDGYVCVEQEDGMYTVTGLTADNAVAAIGETYYQSLAAAIDKVQAGETITLLRDVPNANGIAVPSEKSFTVDFNGHTYTLTGPGAGSSSTETNGFQLLKDSTITFQNGTIRIGQNANNIKRIIQNYANLTLEDMQIYAEHQVGGEDYALSFNNGTIVIKGNTSIYTTSDEAIAFDVCKFSSYPGVTVTFDESYTGTINGVILYDSTDAEKHQLKIKGNGHFGGVQATPGAVDAAKSAVAIYGGYFTSDPSSYVADGYITVISDKEDYSYMVEEKTETDVPVEPEIQKPSVPEDLPDSIPSDSQEAVKEAAKGIEVPELEAAAATEANSITKDQAAAIKAESNLKDDENAKVEVQAYLKIEPQGYDVGQTYTLDITPVYDLVVTSNTAGAQNDVIKKEQPLSIHGKTTVSIPLPEGFVNEAQDVYVQHKGYEYEAQVKAAGEQPSTTYIATFTNPHGFSAFTVTKESAAVAEVNGNRYTSFQDAVDAAGDKATVEVLKNENLTATMSGSSRTITVKNGAGESITVTINGTTKTIEENASVDFTYTHSSSSGTTRYSVEVRGTTGGTVTASPTRAAKGATVTLTVRADEGYQLDGLTVTDSKGGTVKLTDKGSGTYTFTMPASKVTVQATFTQNQSGTLPFTDVKTGDWFYEAVQYVYDKGMMTGVSADRFAPASTTTRGMIVTILYRLENEPAVSGGSAFTDVESGAWYADAVAWAAANDIVNGTSATTFAPNSPITREQMATMLYRFAQYKGMDAVTLQEHLTGYPDGGQVSDYAIPAMNWAVGQGLIAGMENGTLVPQGSATRAQVATILMRFCESIG
ncbi:MAG: S-layer homology domain-containing protein [Evtepia gabavorous]|uniref:S-layer homology domain-containing protein n=4 Tax=Evtepia gabavorous TaxID=2211183 RepID=UPI002E7994D3|nr:S-layer homology domain-containing protein [Evtepia gabavorous]MEE0067461.1 S-layer homology domain-containing protein [Evtepia gabavorous]